MVAVVCLSVYRGFRVPTKRAPIDSNGGGVRFDEWPSFSGHHERIESRKEGGPLVEPHSTFLESDDARLVAPRILYIGTIRPPTPPLTL